MFLANIFHGNINDLTNVLNINADYIKRIFYDVFANTIC
jgi:hypothetical protein